MDKDTSKSNKDLITGERLVAHLLNIEGDPAPPYEEKDYNFRDIIKQKTKIPESSSGTHEGEVLKYN